MKIKVFIIQYVPIFLMLIAICCAAKTQETHKKTIVSNADKTVVCFVYHRVGDSRYPTTNVSAKDFDAHLNWLSKHHYRMLTFSQAIDYLQSDEPEQKIAVITIDDGYKSFFKNGLPLLKKYKTPATIFINTETVGAGDYMDWAMLKTSMESGLEIGNHTHTHNYFMNLPLNMRYTVFKDEIELSQSIIKKNLGFTPVVFTYPYGEFDLQMKSIVKEFGFKAAAAQNSGVVYSGADLFMCPRFPMSESYSSLDKFAEKAMTKPLEILKLSPDDSQMPLNKKPILTLTINTSDLRLDQLQCFVQGGTSDIKMIEKRDDQVTITFQSSSPIKGRRRTLYTITVPDTKGIWHWYSHLWIDPTIKD